MKKSCWVSMLTFSLETQTRRNAERKREIVRERRNMKKLWHTDDELKPQLSAISQRWMKV